MSEANLQPQVFHHFGRLPTEIQAKIWQYTLPGPRVHYIKEIMETSNLGVENQCVVIKCLQVPIAVQVCAQSQYVASLFLQRFQLHTAPVFVGMPLARYGYCNPAIDILHVTARMHDFPQFSLGIHPFHTISVNIQQNDILTEEPNRLPGLHMFRERIPAKIILVTSQFIPGETRHKRCRKTIPLGLPVDSSLKRLQEPLLHTWTDRVSEQLAEIGQPMPKVAIATLPLACLCPGAEMRMGMKVRNAMEARELEELRQRNQLSHWKRSAGSWLKRQT